MSEPQPGEREVLRAALEQVDQKCPWCLTSRYTLRRVPGRWQVQVTHSSRCPVSWSANHRHLCTGYLISVLELYGVFISHYNENDLITHRRLVVL